MNINWNLIGTILIIGIPALSVLLVVLKKLFPGLDLYFKYGYSGLITIYNILDAIVREYPNNNTLNNLHDIVAKLKKEFEEAGYVADLGQLEKIARKDLKKKNGLSVDKDGTIHLNFNKKF